MKKILFIPILFLSMTIAYSKNAKLGSFSASSYLTQQGKNIYTPSCAWDGKDYTAWTEGVKDNGSGEWIGFVVKTRARETLRILKIKNGYQKNQTIYKANNRIKKIRIYFFNSEPSKDEIKKVTSKWQTKEDTPYSDKYFNSDDEEVKVYVREKRLRDRMGWQNIYLQDTQQSAKYIVLQIISTYKGKKYNDTCISEISITTKRSKQKISNDIKG
jgi:hypothetical protein